MSSLSSLTKSLFHDTCKVTVQRLEKQLREEENQFLKKDFSLNVGRFAAVDRHGHRAEAETKTKTELRSIDNNLKGNFSSNG